MDCGCWKGGPRKQPPRGTMQKGSVEVYVSQSRGRYSMTTPVETKGERFLSYSAPRSQSDNAQGRKI